MGGAVEPAGVGSFLPPSSQSADTDTKSLTHTRAHTLTKCQLRGLRVREVKGEGVRGTLTVGISIFFFPCVYVSSACPGLLGSDASRFPLEAPIDRGCMCNFTLMSRPRHGRAAGGDGRAFPAACASDRTLQGAAEPHPSSFFIAARLRRSSGSFRELPRDTAWRVCPVMYT